jgi:hypothetical protein
MNNPPPIKTRYWPKPFPIRRMDWEAWYDGKEESYCGLGATEPDAIADLVANGPYGIEQEDEQLRYETEIRDKP